MSRPLSCGWSPDLGDRHRNGELRASVGRSAGQRWPEKPAVLARRGALPLFGLSPAGSTRQVPSGLGQRRLTQLTRRSRADTPRWCAHRCKHAAVVSSTSNSTRSGVRQIVGSAGLFVLSLPRFVPLPWPTAARCLAPTWTATDRSGNDSATPWWGAEGRSPRGLTIRISPFDLVLG